MDSNKGLALAYLTALVSGISVFVNSFGVLSMDATAYTFVKNALVAAILVAIGISLGKMHEIRALSRKQAFMLLFIGIIGGGVAFALFFSGLAMLAGPVSSFFYRLLFVFAIGTGVLLLKERIDWRVLAGAAIVLAGNFMLLGGAELSLSTGVLLVLAATALWALEYSVSKMALVNLSPITVASARMGIGAFVLLAILAWQGKAGAILAIEPVSIGWIAVAVALLTLFTTLWYSALKNAPLISCAAAFTLGGPISAFLSFALAGKALTLTMAAGFALIAIGVIFAVGTTQTLSAARWISGRATPMISKIQRKSS
jgi:drug/metabolite transporter (DMT)-like permease